MYEVVVKDGLWWISKNGEILEQLGSFIDPVSPEIIVEEINSEIQL